MRALLAKHWFVMLLTLGVGAALCFPATIRVVTDFWEPRWIVASSLLLMAWTMPAQSLLDELRRPFASAWAVFLSYGWVPLAAWLLGLLAAEDVQVGLILVSSVPCTMSSAVLWTRMAGGNEATALMTVMGTTFLSWFLTTAWLSWFTGAAIDLDAPAMMRDLVLSLIVPIVIGQALRWVPPCERFADKHRVSLSALSQCLVLAIVLKAGAVVGERLHQDNLWDTPQVFLWSIVLSVLLHLLALASGLYTSRWLGFDRGRQLAVAFACSQKTLPISLMLYEQYFRLRFPFAVLPLLFYHIGQLLLDTIIAKHLRRGPNSGDFPSHAP